VLITQSLAYGTLVARGGSWRRCLHGATQGFRFTSDEWLVGRPDLNTRGMSVEGVGRLSPGQGVTATLGSGTLSRTEP
jgi:hypothetical protein